MVKPVEKWECGHCGELHDDEDEANECCQPTIAEKWECGECGEVYDSESEAEECCTEAFVECFHKFPKAAVTTKKYIAEFCKLNNLKP